MYLRFFFIPIVLLSLTCSLSGQSAWDIKYIFESSFNDSLIGRDVKVDFRDSKRESPQSKHPINFLSREDTGIVLLCGTDTLKLAEKRSIHADWGLFKEQYLESSDYLLDETIVFRTIKFVIIKVLEDSVSFELHASIFKVTKRKEKNIGNKVFNVSISRDDLDGVMTKEASR